jgi:UPF0271 protein
LDHREVVERTVKAIKKQEVVAINGGAMHISRIHTVCVHGDTPAATKLAEMLKKGLTKAGIALAPVGSFI